MTQLQNPSGFWTKERVFESANQYKTKLEWFKGCQRAYAKAQSKGWLSEATAHMTKPALRQPKPRGYWTKERVLEIAKQYKSKKEWYIGCQRAYAKAQAMGWLTEATMHMQVYKVDKGH